MKSLSFGLFISAFKVIITEKRFVLARSANKVIAAIASAAMAASLCPVSAAFAQNDTELLGASTATHSVTSSFSGEGAAQVASPESAYGYVEGEGSGEGSGEEAGAGTGAGSGENAGSYASAEASTVLEVDAVTTAKSLIAALPTAPQITAAGAGVYDTQVNEAVSAYQALSETDQQTLDSTLAPGSGQSYGRILENAQWAAAAMHEVDASTTLSAGTYSATTTPALSSEYSKGKSTSPRQRPWSVKDITVTNGKAYGTITVQSDSYTYIYMAGQKFENTAKTGYSTFEKVPLDLNSTQYFTAYSTSMVTEIVFSLTTTIDESASGGDSGDASLFTPEQVEALIAALPRDPYDYTVSYVVQVYQAQTAYDSLTDTQKAQVNSTMLPVGLSCERALEVANWAVKSLAVVDNSTTLAEGTYELDKTAMETDMGCSVSSRNYSWSVQKIVVKNGKATATLKRNGGNTPVGSAYFEGRVVPANSDGTITIPLALNTDLYFAVLPSSATAETVGISYHLNTAFDVDNATPTGPVESDDQGGSGSGGGSGSESGSGSGSGSGAGSGSGSGTASTPTASSGVAASGNALSLTTSGSGTTKTSSASSGATSANANQNTTAKTSTGNAGSTASNANALGEATGAGSDTTQVHPLAIGGGFAGFALAGGIGFTALFRKREQH